MRYALIAIAALVGVIDPLVLTSGPAATIYTLTSHLVHVH